MTIRDVDIKDALGERYLAYALSTIMQRSLPDVRDGLKPVHRRLLYAMRELRLDPKSGYKKCARVVGDVIGKFHPHGDAAIYEAMVRLAQDFSVRFPLVDGHGNFGNIDGDGAAAMRYTEARLTAFANALMEGLDSDAVDFKATYDGEHSEPLVMPAVVPNLLANGSTGIAVGMATSIPPHNLDEICTALKLLIHNPDATIEQLLDVIPGPDFPTGGILIEPKENILKAYTTGRGSFRVRAKWDVETLKGGQYQIVITEIPYMVQKAKLIERIADLMAEKKLPFLDNVRDESTDQMRLILDPKSRTIDPQALMESLFRVTDLENRFPLNMNVLDKRSIPSVMDLKQVLVAFINHRLDILERTTKFRLEKIDHRLEVLGGYLIAYLNLDEVIRIIREEDEPAPFMKEKWNLSDVQVEAILNMKLRNLRKLEETEIRTEFSTLENEKADLLRLLSDPALQKEKIIEDLNHVQKTFGKKTNLGKRRTHFGDVPDDSEIPVIDIEREPVTIVCSEKSWIRSMKGHGVESADIKYKEGDQEKFVIKAETTDKLIIFTSSGKSYTLPVDKLPGGRGQGEPLRLMIDVDAQEEIVSLLVFNASLQDGKVVLLSSEGKGFVTALQNLVAQTKNGKQILNLKDSSQKATHCLLLGGDHLALVGENRKLLIIKTEEIPELQRGQGVTLQRYKNGKLSDAKVYNSLEGLTWAQGERKRTEINLELWLGKRSQVGRLVPHGFPRTNKFN